MREVPRGGADRTAPAAGDSGVPSFGEAVRLFVRLPVLLPAALGLVAVILGNAMGPFLTGLTILALALAAHDFVAFCVLRVSPGIAPGMLSPIAFVYINEWAPGCCANRFATIVFVLPFSPGGILAGVAGLALTPRFGWHALYLVRGARHTDRAAVPQDPARIGALPRGQGAMVAGRRHPVARPARPAPPEPDTAIVIDDLALLRQAQAFSNLSDIDRIAIFRGPQGTLFGKGASAGGVNITTRAPSIALTYGINGSVTSDEQFRIDGNVSGAIADGVRCRISGFVGKNDGYIRDRAHLLARLSAVAVAGQRIV